MSSGAFVCCCVDDDAPVAAVSVDDVGDGCTPSVVGDGGEGANVGDEGVEDNGCGVGASVTTGVDDGAQTTSSKIPACVPY